MSAKASQTLQVELKAASGATKIVRVAGSASMETGNELRDRLVGLLEPNTRHLILDLTELEFINSVGLGGIIAAHLRCRRAEGEILLAAPQPAIRELLDVTRLTKLFSIHDSVDSALAAC
jgi:anti-anti-sigma factor